MTFLDPQRYLAAPVAAPSVQLGSPALVTRHVHAALLSAFLRTQTEGLSVGGSVGWFFGATENADDPVQPGAQVEAFLDWLRADPRDDRQLSDQIAALVRGTVVGQDLNALSEETAEALESLLRQWREEYRALLEGAAASDQDAKTALSNRAKRMRGEFLLGELARRGFTPAYGFPVDVVTFDYLSGRKKEATDDAVNIAFGERWGGASRVLDVAIREYAPGTEVVVDGLVHRSEGILPAWSAMADTSGIEDLRLQWECDNCHASGLARVLPSDCPSCDAPAPRWHRALRPAGFLGRRAPHTGYENLGHVPYEMPRLHAGGAPWQALPDPEMGRIRADPVGNVVTLSAGAEGHGYALCLYCGRAEAETEEPPNATPALSESMRRHRPLKPGRRLNLVAGYCPGGSQGSVGLQRNIRLVHDAHTDVFELQLPAGATPQMGLAFAAALREALAERLGPEAREIGIAVDRSAGPAQEPRVSAFLHDRAAGGAGFVTRLAEADWFSHCLARAKERLACPGMYCGLSDLRAAPRPKLLGGEARSPRGVGTGYPPSREAGPARWIARVWTRDHVPWLQFGGLARSSARTGRLNECYSVPARRTYGVGLDCLARR